MSAPVVCIRAGVPPGPNRRARSAILCACVAILFPSPAAAGGESSDDDRSAPELQASAEDDPDQPDDSNEGSSEHTDQSDNPRVTTVAEAADAAAQSRRPSGWITRLELDDTFAAGGDLGRELSRVEGVAVRRRSSLGQPAYATVRGGSPRQLAVHLNGIRIGAPAGIGFDVGGLSTASIDSVDVFRGSAAAPWGSGALTGAMNLEMRPPEGSGWETSATSMGGSFGTVGLSARAAGAGNGVRGDVAASWRQSQGDFQFVDQQGTSHTRVNNGHRQLAAGGTIGGEVHGGDLTAALLHEDIQRGTPGPSEFQDAFRRAQLESRRTVGTVRWNRRGIASPDWGVVDLDLVAGAVHRPLHYSNPDGFPAGTPVDNRSKHSSFEARARLDSYFDAGNIAKLNLGFRTQHFRGDFDSGESSAPSADRQTLSLGLSDELLLFDEALSLLAGLRAQAVSGRRGFEFPLIPSGGLIWRPAEFVRLKANLARSHRIPDFDELFLRTETIRGNPDLEAERALNADLGLQLGGPDGPARGTLTFFHSDIRDMILFVPQTAYLFRAENLSSATARGIEASGSVELRRHFRLRGSYTHTRARLDSLPDVQLPHHPAHRGSISSGVELAGLGPLDSLRSLELTAEMTARSSVHLDNFGSLENGPYAQVDFGAAIRPNRHLTFGLQLRNATDNRHGADFLQRPLPGRSLYGSIQLREGTLSQ